MPEHTSTIVSRLSYGQYCALRKGNLVRMRIDDACAPELIPYLNPRERFTHRLWSAVWMLLIPGFAVLLIAQEFIVASGVLLLVSGMPKAIKSNTSMAIEAAGLRDPEFFELLNALKGVRFMVYSRKV